MAFERSFTEIKKLKEEPLFKKCLLPDIVGGERGRGVFPAVRKNRIDFYHKGGKLFSYDGRSGFTTHYKYASVIRGDDRRPYVTDRNLQAIESFAEGYNRIKENCSLYSGVEAIGVSWVYGQFSCAKHIKTRHVSVLDIEVSLKRSGEEEEAQPGAITRANSDRIDLLLFDTECGLLRFFEAKDFSNNEIRAIPDRVPKIVKQMERYEKQLSTDSVRQEMLTAYSAHIEAINQLFSPERKLPAPQDIDPVPRLLLFGYDKSQYTEKLKHEEKRLEKEYSLNVYAIGDIRKVDPHTLFCGGKKRW